MSLRIKVFTVPGQVLHSSTRRLVLQGADGVAFIADSQITETENNAASFLDLRDEPEGARPQREDAAARHPVQQARPARASARDAEIEALAQHGEESRSSRRAR